MTIMVRLTGDEEDDAGDALINFLDTLDEEQLRELQAPDMTIERLTDLIREFGFRFQCECSKCTAARFRQVH